MRKHISFPKAVKRCPQTNYIIHKTDYGYEKYNAKKLFYILIHASSPGSEDLNPGVLQKYIKNL